MSDDAPSGERSAVGPFLVGLAVGAALGALFAPAPGAATRTRLARRAGRLRDDVADVVEEVRSVLADGGDAPPAAGASRDALRARLAAARAARNPAPGLPGSAGDPPPA